MLDTRVTVKAAANLAEEQGHALGLPWYSEGRQRRQRRPWVSIPQSVQPGLTRGRPHAMCYMMVEEEGGEPEADVEELSALDQMIVTSALRDDTSESDSRGPEAADSLELYIDRMELPQRMENEETGEVEVRGRS